MTADCLNTYPDYNLPFEINTDASDYQLGAAIIQNGQPVAYWSRSLQNNQMKYTTTEKELIAIILCLKEYEKILYRAKIKFFIDHKNLIFKTLLIKRILCWRTYIDQYDVDLCYIPGKENVSADCFSPLPRMDSVSSISGKERPPLPQSVASFDCVNATEHRKRKQKREAETFVDFKQLESPPDKDFNIDGEAFFSINECNEAIECLLNLPESIYMDNPIKMQNIHNHQLQCVDLQHLKQINSNLYWIEVINGVDITVYRERNESRWCICLPLSLVNQVIKWYHFTLGHCGVQQLYDTINN